MFFAGFVRDTPRHRGPKAKGRTAVVSPAGRLPRDGDVFSPARGPKNQIDIQILIQILANLPKISQIRLVNFSRSEGPILILILK